MWIKRAGGIFSFVLSGVLLSGCGSTMAVSEGGANGMQAPSVIQSLAAMNWSLSTVQYEKNAPTANLKAGIPTKRYTLNFSGDSISLQGGCNTAGSHFQLSSPDKMTVGEWRSTRRACLEDALMRADSEVTGLLSSVSNYRLNAQRLTLSGGGNTLVLNGTATDVTRYKGEGVRKFIEVRNTRKGLSWRVATYDNRWIQDNKNAPWIQGNFPGIRDFKPEMNMAYTIRINEFRDSSLGQAVWVKDMVIMQGILQ